MFRPLLMLLAVFVSASFVIAQQPAREPLPDMQSIAAALGVQCDYCHVRGPGAVQSNPSKISVAKQMIAMTRELNTTIQTATAKTAGTAAKVECLTCHRGVPIPRQLSDVLAETTLKQGSAAAIEQYRDLRARFYGKQAYDFSEPMLIALSQRLANVRPDDAIAMAKLNIEFYPNSSTSYAALAFAYTRKVDDASAITAYEKAVELDPNNGVVRGALEQLKSYQRRR